ncbi:MAG TPA: 30S ribosomal protein S6 [Myxococcaceae bacterium]|jgi:small subunit ribosomal protein S6|nr:30S ribosomal protein S6 [Myxococcaceae bacterium]
MAEAQARAKSHLREYETLFLVKPDLTDDAVDKIKDRVRGVVSRDGGKMIRFTVWGKKKLSYPVAKQNRAIYVHAHYLGGTSLVAEVERNLRIVDEVTRYISSRIADDVDPSTRETLEDVKLAGDVEERAAVPEREPAVPGFREEEAPEPAEEETPEEA